MLLGPALGMSDSSSQVCLQCHMVPVLGRSSRCWCSQDFEKHWDYAKIGWLSASCLDLPLLLGSPIWKGTHRVMMVVIIIGGGVHWPFVTGMRDAWFPAMHGQPPCCLVFPTQASCRGSASVISLNLHENRSPSSTMLPPLPGSMPVPMP